MIKTNPTIGWQKKRPHNLESLSPTAVIEYVTCGLAWRLNHIDHIQFHAPQPVYYPFGGAFHRGLEPHWKGKEHQFKRAWSVYKGNQNILWKNQSWLSWYQKGLAMTTAIIMRTQGLFDPKTSIVESGGRTEEVDLGFILLRRRLDVILDVTKMPILIDSRSVPFTGRINGDLKSSSQLYTAESARQSQQLMSYAIPNKKRPYGKIDLSVFMVATKAVKPQVQIIGRQFDKEEIKGQLYRLKFVADAIRRGEFPQFKGEHCGTADYGCPFRCLCYELPGWQQMYSITEWKPRKEKRKK